MIGDDQVRDRRFRHELFPQGAPLVRLADAVVADLLAYEAREGTRRRRRKVDDAKAMRRAVHVIVANLAHAVLFPLWDGGDTALILPAGHARAKHVEKPHEGFGEALPGLLESLHAVGALTLTKPEHYRHATTVAPTRGFRVRLMAEGVTPDDIGREIDPERLVRVSRRDGDRRSYFPVPETVEAHQHRGDLACINRSLADATITYLGNDLVDVGDRLLVRRFNLPEGIDQPCLNYGGRLWGGFWQNMRRERRVHIRIGGEAVVELDYGQMLLRLAYGLVGASPPVGTDLYAIPGLGGYRDGVKQGVNALLWGARGWGPEIIAALPHGWSAKRLCRAVAEHHPAVAHLLQSGPLTGYRLLHRESAVVVAVLLACVEAGIVALPIHDAVLVPVSAADAVAKIMAQAAINVAGVSIPVHQKG